MQIVEYSVHATNPLIFKYGNDQICNKPHINLDGRRRPVAGRRVDVILEAIRGAFGLMLRLDANLLEIVCLSLQVSLSAVAIATALALPLGAAIAVSKFPGRQTVIVILNALMGLPPVVVGLVVYLMLSRAGPLGELGLLFSPPAMVIAQTILILPIIAALARQAVEDAWREYQEQLRSLGAGGWSAALTLVWDIRFSLLTAVLAGLGRAAAEVGAVMIVGGNIDGVTRVMTTAIALETSKGDLPLALGLGVILVTLVLVLNAAAYTLKEAAQRRYG
jgi:tungstate transport system permease protein